LEDQVGRFFLEKLGLNSLWKQGRELRKDFTVFSERNLEGLPSWEKRESESQLLN